jgi:predicted ATPase
MPVPRRVIVTGGPGAGKTTLLAALARCGHSVMQDSAREIIRSRKARGLPPRPEPEEFANEILLRDIEQYHSAEAFGAVFYERGIPDALGMLHDLRMITEPESRGHSVTHPYLRTVFVLPPWEEIYVTDDEREHTFAHSVQVYNEICDWYARMDYELVEVHHGPVPDRCAQILTCLERK